MNFFDDLIAKVSLVGFSPVLTDEKYAVSYSLHTLIRDGIGMAEHVEIKPTMDSNIKISAQSVAYGRKGNDVVKGGKRWSISADLADLAYWDFEVYRKFLHQIHNLLGNELSKESGKNVTATVWASTPERTLSEIINLLEKVKGRFTGHLTPPIAIKRPSASGIILEGKVFGAIGNTCAVIAANGINYGDLFDLMAERTGTNEKLLEYLDAYTVSNELNRTLVDRKSQVPRSFVMAHQRYKNQFDQSSQIAPSMSGYLRSIRASQSFSENDDQRLIERFSQIEPGRL